MAGVSVQAMNPRLMAINLVGGIPCSAHMVRLAHHERSEDSNRLVKKGSTVPTCRDCRESEGVPQIQILPPSRPEPALSPPKGRGSGGWSKEFLSTLLEAGGAPTCPAGTTGAPTPSDWDGFTFRALAYGGKNREYPWRFRAAGGTF